jgi:hypothetical protein
MRAMRVVAVVAAVVMLSAAAEAAEHDYLDGAHWNVAHGLAAGRTGAVLIVDATGDPRALEALRAFKAEWNAMRAMPALRALPAVDLATAPSSACSSTRLRHPSAGAGRVYVCLDDALATAAVGGPFLVDSQGHTAVGLVKLRTRTLSWTACNLRTAVAHELGHVMGLAHNDAGGFVGGPSVMMSGKAPYGRGCPAWFNAHDRDALRTLYDDHARSIASAPGSPTPSVD